MKLKSATLVPTLLLFLASCGGEQELSNTQDSVCSAVRAPRELMIRQLSVVNDATRTRWTGGTGAADGAWHFGRLMANMAGDQNPSDFVRNWLSNFENQRTINSDAIPARPGVADLLIASWPKLANGKLDLTKAPLRLLAIVNRIDLRNVSRGHAGEGRFVFGVLDANGNSTQFTIILEYLLLAGNETEMLAWADRWHNLGALDPNSAAYRSALTQITNRFAGKNVATGRPNGSAISQVRTNEIEGGFPWELREFRLNGTPVRLREVTVAQSPRNELNGTARVRDFVNNREAAILAGTHVVPLSFQSVPFRAGASENNIDFWSAAGIRNNDARHIFSLNTCNGCHGAETGTFFLHVSPRERTVVAPLSGFLTGIDVPDPVSGVTRRFNDLSRRAQDLEALVCRTPGAVALESLGSAEEESAGRVH